MGALIVSMLLIVFFKLAAINTKPTAWYKKRILPFVNALHLCTAFSHDSYLSKSPPDILVNKALIGHILHTTIESIRNMVENIEEYYKEVLDRE
jgi:hypothetical protein